MRQAVIVFTKVPRIGDIKTRLTKEKGGILTPEEAKILYEACLLDVIEVAMAACEDEGAELWICHDAAGDGAYLQSLLKSLAHPEKVKGVFADRGGSFDDCMQFAADYILKPREGTRKADSVIIIGGDLPTLQPATLKKAFTALARFSQSEAGREVVLQAGNPSTPAIGAALVEAPCQEGGFSLVGYTWATPFDFYGVFYNSDGITALDMLVNKAVAKKIPFTVLEMVPDVDIPIDLASIIPVLRSLELAAATDADVMVPRRTLAVLRELGLEATALPPER
ncbi:MAG: hypothetical protein PWP70_1058 [Moorella sp. (in: firmicutes)]|nr:hypothetical protein [Moorella sp. (in: firmicutes)]